MMDTSVGLNQSLKQQLTLSPQLIQSFEILAMSVLELQQRVKTEIEANPALEIPAERSVSLERLAERQDSRIDDNYGDSVGFGIGARSDSQSGTRQSYSYDQEAADRNARYIDGALSRSETLQEYLLRQLGCLRLTDEQMELGALIISNLDQNGFHKLPVESLVAAERQQALQGVLSIVQTLDPPGIAVADFRESLILQAKIDNLSPHDIIIFERLVCEHLEQLRMNKTKEVAKELGIDEDELATLYQYLKSLNPYPGLQYSNDETHYAIPELFVHIVDGHLQMHVNSEAAPLLTIDKEFVNLHIDARDEHYKEVASYINNAVKSANLLISQIQMRYETMKKIGLQLLKFQYDFFLKGPRYLKPLTYRTIAEELNLHETTVSRAVQGKYIDTDWGIIPLKELFSSAVQTTVPGGEDMSKRAVMDILKEIIEAHQSVKPLSDQKLADMLAQRGIKIARRTVAKYRQALNIESSYIRS